MRENQVYLARCIARGSRTALTCSGAVLAMVASATAASAQEGTAPQSSVEDEAIVVTGSRLRLTTGMETPVPVTAVEATELKAMAPTTLVEGLSQLPQFYGNSTQQANNFFSSGSSGSLNLRGLGANRTLVLLNGRRMPSATAFGGVDITNFPEALIANIETVTGGASAAYGTDAVAGVTNFILNTRFTGLKIGVQGGMTTRGDGENYQVSATWGVRLGDRGHFILSAERFEQQGIHSFEGRDWYQGWSTVADAKGVLQIYPHVVSRQASYNGIIGAAKSSPLYGLMFNKDGSVSSYISSSIASGDIGVSGALGGGGARQALVGNASGQDLGGGEITTLQPDFERSSIFAYADYELSDNLTLFAQYIRGRKTQSSFNAPRGIMTGAPTNITIYQDNAFLPDSLRQLMVANNIASFNLQRTGSIEDLAASYRISDETLLNTALGGFDLDIHSDGGFLDGWRVEGYYQYGHSKRQAYQVGLRVDRIYAAVDAVRDANGNIVCRTTLFSNAFAGCQPLNLFGAGNASPQAIDYVIGYDPGQSITTPLYFAGAGYTGATDSYVSQEAKVNITTLQQHIAEISANGELHRGWGAGPITLAVGGSYRQESIYQIVRDPGNKPSDHTLGPNRTQNPCLSAAAQAAAGLRGQAGGDCNNTVFTQFSKVSNLDNKISVKEAFGEVLVPLLADVPAIRQLSVNLAVRWAEYTGSGSVWAYKGGVDWTIIEGLRARGTYSRDVRAANLSERYDVTGGSVNVVDPKFKADGSVAVTRFSGGNPNVAPEKADTLTAGAVFQPTFLPGLSVSLDWYRIKMDGAIGQIGSQAVLDGCEAGNAALCSQITRDATTNKVLLVGDVFINVDKAVISGVDLEASYRTSLSLLGGDESLSGRLFASWLIENSQRLGSVFADRAGQTGIQQSDGVAYSLPRFKLTSSMTYRKDGLSAFVQGRYISPGTMENSSTASFNVANIGHNRVTAAFYVDTRIGYTFDVGGRALEIYGNVTNLLDKDPPITPYWAAFGSNAVQTNGALFDQIGRRFVIGAKVSL